MKTVLLIGSGQIGSRHLQGLKKVKIPLDIYVVDVSVDSLKIAKERYDSISVKNHHKINFRNSLVNISKKIDLCIVATNSNVRRRVMEELLKHFKIKSFVLEKLLFQRYEDYILVEKLLKKNKCKAWVNCSMRMMPFYNSLKKEFGNNPIQYIVSGSRYGLITNSIHYIDHISFLTNCYDFEVETNFLDKKLIKSKRKGFLEINGTLNIHFKNGSNAALICYPDGDLPIQVEIFNNYCRLISRESEGRAWISESRENWKWKDVENRIPFQSDMTTNLVEEIITKGSCVLTNYKDSSKAHLILLESLLKFLNKNSMDFDYFPFT